MGGEVVGRCPKCGSGEVSTVGWELSTEREYYDSDGFHDSEFTGCSSTGVYPWAETTCMKCGLEGTPREFNFEPLDPLEASLRDWGVFPRQVAFLLWAIKKMNTVRRWWRKLRKRVVSAKECFTEIVADRKS